MVKATIPMADPKRADSHIVIGCDHAGYALKAALHVFLKAHHYTVVDVGCFSADDKVDYPNVAAQVVETMRELGAPRGLITCGSGVGVAMAANRFPDIRAVHAGDAYLAKLRRLHNDSNVLCMGGRFVATDYAQEILSAWLATDFEGERHEARVAQLGQLGSGAAPVQR